jgi:hypothetical protein
MRIHHKVVITLSFGFFVTTAAPSHLPAQDIKSGVVNSRDQILNPTTNQQQQTQQNTNQSSPPAEKGKPGPLPCDSKNNPKCDNVTKTKPGD